MFRISNVKFTGTDILGRCPTHSYSILSLACYNVFHCYCDTLLLVILEPNNSTLTYMCPLNTKSIFSLSCCHYGPLTFFFFCASCRLWPRRVHVQGRQLPRNERPLWWLQAVLGRIRRRELSPEWVRMLMYKVEAICNKFCRQVAHLDWVKDEHVRLPGWRRRTVVIVLSSRGRRLLRDE